MGAPDAISPMKADYMWSKICFSIRFHREYLMAQFAEAFYTFSYVTTQNLKLFLLKGLMVLNFAFYKYKLKMGHAFVFGPICFWNSKQRLFKKQQQKKHPIYTHSRFNPIKFKDNQFKFYMWKTMLWLDLFL